MKRFLSFVVCTTLAGLAYVYTEVEAVKIGYTIRKQEESKVQMLDRSRALKYNIASLKAPHNLERRLLAQSILLESPKQWQTLVIANSQGGKKPAAAVQSSIQAPFFTKFFLGTAQAEAKEPPSR